jgi:hypothetical protein
MPNTFKNEEYADMHFYMVSAMEMIGQPWWNTGNDICFTKLDITKYLRMYREL